MTCKSSSSIKGSAFCQKGEESKVREFLLRFPGVAKTETVAVGLDGKRGGVAPINLSTRGLECFSSCCWREVAKPAPKLCSQVLALLPTSTYPPPPPI